MSVGLPKTCPFHEWAQLPAVCVCLWSARSAAFLLKTIPMWRQAGRSRKDRNGMPALLGSVGERARWELSCLMPCCRGKAKPWSMPAVNQILFGTLLVSLPVQRVVILKLGRCSSRGGAIDEEVKSLSAAAWSFSFYRFYQQHYPLYSWACCPLTRDTKSLNT